MYQITTHDVRSTVDDFGHEVLILSLPIDTFNAQCRYLLDGMVEGINSGLSVGNAPDCALSFFGLI